MIKTDEELRNVVLRSWITVNEFLEELTEEEVRRALHLELDGRRRIQVALRLANRFHRLKRLAAGEKIKEALAAEEPKKRVKLIQEVLKEFEHERLGGD